MSDLQFNSIAGAVLASVLGVMAVGTISEGVLEPHYPAKAGYLPEVQETSSGGPAAPEAPPDFGTLFADPAQLADLVAHGQRVHAVCISCHNFDAGGPNGTGPNLHDVFGRHAGTHPGFSYSPAMVSFGQVWSYDTLNTYLTSPQSEVRGNKMAFAGIRNTNDRVALIAFLRSLSPNAPPLPAPNPAPTQAAAGAAPPAAGAPTEAAGSPAAPATGATPAAAPAAPAPAPGGAG